MSKRIGAVPEETKEWILSAAIDEFFEYGLSGSSLRRICSNAGVTTGALYFFFENKDDLFKTVISKVTDPFTELINEHYRYEQTESNQYIDNGSDADFEISRLLIDLYFKNQKIWDILLHHLNHPAVQNFIDSFIDISTEHYIKLLDNMDLSKRKEPIDEFLIHQYVHMQVDAMLTLISHDFNKEDMTKHSKAVIKMLRGAFQVLITE